MDFLPVFLRLQQQRVLLVGGGQVALRKARLLLRAQAELTVVAGNICEELATLLKPPHLAYMRNFQETDLDGVVLVVAATDDQIVNRRVSTLAHARKLPVNVVDQPALCSFIFPSIVDRSPLLVAVSSGGSAPVLSRLLRARLETLIPSAYGTLVQLLGRHRDLVKSRLLNTKLRMRFWEGIINGPVAELVLSGQKEKAELLFQATLNQNRFKMEQGEVYLVGAGPGDPDLLTFRALRLMQQADVVLFDRLVSPEILALVRQDAERIHVGKQRSDHTMAQEEISRLLVKLASQGKRVLRLKGGDPFIFGRGGEEISRLAEARIPFQIVPGITAASGCAAYAGIPLTHRDYAHSVRFVTGHLKDDSCNLEWPQLVQPGQTVVFYMGLVSLPQICEQLMLHGAAKTTPIALIEQGTTPNQRVHTGTLATLPALVVSKNVQPPTLIIVGEVVKLHEQLRWREEGAGVISIRTATAADARLILDFIIELATYERAVEQVVATEEQIRRSLFGQDAKAKALVCMIDGVPAGFAVYFFSYSTWLGRNGINMEDLYVSPQFRGRGAGKALLQYLAALAVEHKCGRLEWNVLDWNTPAIGFYRALGAEPLTEWTRYRLSGAALSRAAQTRG